MKRLFALFPIIMLALAACGSAGTGTGGSTTGATATKSTSCLTVASGTIQNISGSSLELATLQGRNVQVALSSKTIYARQSTLTSSAIKTGTPVSVVVMLNSDNTYTAVTVSLRSSQLRQGGFSGSTRLCSGQGLFPGRSGTPGAFRTPGAFGTPGAGGTGQLRQTITGTVSQISGKALIVTDTSGNDLTVNLTATTRITAEEVASFSDLRSGLQVSVTGMANSQGVITANLVAIVQGFPNRRPATTPTASA